MDKMYVLEVFGKSRILYSSYDKAEEAYNKLVDEHCKEWSAETRQELIEECSNYVSGEANYIKSFVDEMMDYALYLYDVDVVEEN